MNKIIEITGTLERENVSIANQILKASKDVNVTSIILLINSSGGDIDIIIPIWEAIKMSKKDIIAIGMIEVSSAASSIFMMAGRRILLPNTMFLLHKASVELEKRFYSCDELLEYVESANEATQISWEPVIENSSLTWKILNRKCKGKDWILSEEELLSYGIVTEKYDREKVAELLDLM